MKIMKETPSDSCFKNVHIKLYDKLFPQCILNIQPNFQLVRHLQIRIDNLTICFDSEAESCKCAAFLDKY